MVDQKTSFMVSLFVCLFIQKNNYQIISIILGDGGYKAWKNLTQFYIVLDFIDHGKKGNEQPCHCRLSPQVCKPLWFMSYKSAVTWKAWCLGDSRCEELEETWVSWDLLRGGCHWKLNLRRRPSLSLYLSLSASQLQEAACLNDLHLHRLRTHRLTPEEAWAKVNAPPPYVSWPWDESWWTQGGFPCQSMNSVGGVITATLFTTDLAGILVFCHFSWNFLSIITFCVLILPYLWSCLMDIYNPLFVFTL